MTQLVNLILLGGGEAAAPTSTSSRLRTRLRVRYRIDGVLYEQASPPKHLEQALVSRLKVMARMDIAERRLPQDGMARVGWGSARSMSAFRRFPWRRASASCCGCWTARRRCFPLGSWACRRDQRRFEALLARPNGIIVVSGPTGSGKTTTLYAALAGWMRRAGTS